MERAKERLREVIDELWRAKYEVEAKALEAVVAMAKDLEPLMEEIAPGVKGIRLGEGTGCEVEAGFFPVVTTGGLLKQGLSKRGKLVPVTATQVVAEYDIQDILNNLEGELEEADRKKSADPAEA
jgi:hypothetical protein